MSVVSPISPREVSLLFEAVAELAAEVERQSTLLSGVAEALGVDLGSEGTERPAVAAARHRAAAEAAGESAPKQVEKILDQINASRAAALTSAPLFDNRDPDGSKRRERIEAARKSGKGVWRHGPHR